MNENYQFDIALSFAGEDRDYVDEVAKLLRSGGVKVFYDVFEESNLWGKDLYEYLTDIYRNKALYTIMFISDNYAKKLWTTHERKSMQSRAFEEHKEYILPAKFDKTEVPGLLPTVGYISLTNKTVSDFVDIVLQKLVNSGIKDIAIPINGKFELIYEIRDNNNDEIIDTFIAAESWEDIIYMISEPLLQTGCLTWMSNSLNGYIRNKYALLIEEKIASLNSDKAFAWCQKDSLKRVHLHLFFSEIIEPIERPDGHGSIRTEWRFTKSGQSLLKIIYYKRLYENRA